MGVILFLFLQYYFTKLNPHKKQATVTNAFKCILYGDVSVETYVRHVYIHFLGLG